LVLRKALPLVELPSLTLMRLLLQVSQPERYRRHGPAQVAAVLGALIEAFEILS
jgi:hypothetical protein